MAKFIEKSHFIKLQNDEWLRNQQIAGKCVATTLSFCKKIIINKEPNLSLKRIEEITLNSLKEHKCIATFQGFKGFPSALCTSVNNQLVHGIATDYILQDGDVVKLDLGATYNDAIADSALTCIYGKPKSNIHIRLIDTCEKALELGIQAVKREARVGAIGEAISKFVKSTEFGLVIDHGGHGIDKDRPHAPPFVSNKDKSSNGIRFQPGFTFAIEPMLVVGYPNTKVLSDKWTVVTPGVGAHTEHTLYVDDNTIHVITKREDNIPNYLG